MQLVLVQTPDIPPIPKDVKVLNNWGRVWVMPQNESGDHIHVEGTEEAIRTWLGSINFYKGEGPPMAQSFKIVKFKH